MANKLIQDLGAGAFALTDLLEHQPIAGPPSLKGDINALVTLLSTVYGTGPFLPLAGGTMVGNILFSADNTRDIGASGATRPRTGYWGTSLVSPLLDSPAATALSLASAGTVRANFSTAGHLLFNTDDANDIGATGATRPRTGYFGTSVISPLFTGALTGAASLNVLKAGDTMTGKLIITQATANTAVLTSTGYSLTGADATSMVNLAGTWNTSGNPTAFKLSITNTASGATAKLFDLLLGATSVFSADKNGQIRIPFGMAGALFILNTIGGDSSQSVWTPSSSLFQLNNAGLITWGSGSNVNSPDLGVSRNAAGVAEINSSTPGTFRDLKLRALTMAAAGLLSITSGANQRAGNATLVGGTITVANTTVTANTVIMLTRKTSGGTIGTAITYTLSASTSFTINSDSVIDTSTFSYLLIEVP